MVVYSWCSGKGSRSSLHLLRVDIYDCFEALKHNELHTEQFLVYEGLSLTALQRYSLVSTSVRHPRQASIYCVTTCVMVNAYPLSSSLCTGSGSCYRIREAFFATAQGIKYLVSLKSVRFSLRHTTSTRASATGTQQRFHFHPCPCPRPPTEPQSQPRRSQYIPRPSSTPHLTDCVTVNEYQINQSVIHSHKALTTDLPAHTRQPAHSECCL